MKYTYDSILTIVKANGDLFDTGGVGSLSGTFEIDLKPYQDAVLQLDFKEFKDQQLENDITATAANPNVDLLLGINKQGIGDSISDTNHGSIIIDSERVVINAKDDFAHLFGSTGVALGSPSRVNIDAGKSITLFAHDKILLGLPNKGLPFKQTTQVAAGGTTKGDPTPDQEYEPLVLGIKLANLFEDILFFLKKADLVSGVSPVRFQPATLAEFALLANRIPEILSSYAFVDGYSHEAIDQENLKQLKEAQRKAENYTPPTQITGSVVGVVSVGAGGGGGGSVTDDDVWRYLAWNQGAGGASEHYKIAKGTKKSYSIETINITKNWPSKAVASNGVTAADIVRLYNSDPQKLALGFIDVWKQTYTKKVEAGLAIVNGGGKNRSGLPFADIKAAFYAAATPDISGDSLISFGTIENGLNTDTNNSKTFGGMFQMNKTYDNFAAFLNKHKGGQGHKPGWTEYGKDNIRAFAVDAVPLIVDNFNKFKKTSGYPN